MGEISRKIYKKLKSSHGRLKRCREELKVGSESGSEIPSLADRVSSGFDPVHAMYGFMQNLSSIFGELLSTTTELHAFAKVAGDAEDEYMPLGPPMSPLTKSFFACWLLYDLQFGKDRETIGQCQIDCSDLFEYQPDLLAALQSLVDSRMGIYEHVGFVGHFVLLKELITGDEFECLCPAGYRGKVGQLWYVRRVPPLLPPGNYHVLLTTPYVLLNSKEDWIQYLRRTLVKVKGSDDRERLHRFLKYGLDTNYWNEFVFLAYLNHEPTAIYLTGIPDLRSSLPHAKR